MSMSGQIIEQVDLDNDPMLALIAGDKAADIFSVSTLKSLRSVTPEIMALGVDELKLHGKLTLTDEQLRIRLQSGFTSALKRGRNLRDGDIFRGVCTATYYYHGFLKDPYKVAYALQPIVQYENKMEALLESAISRYKDLINMDITSPKIITVLDENGKKVSKQVVDIDPKKAMVLLNVIKSVEERVKGSVLQKNLNITAAEPKTEDGESASLDVSMVDKRIAELEHKLNPFREVIDVTPIHD